MIALCCWCYFGRPDVDLKKSVYVLDKATNTSSYVYSIREECCVDIKSGSKANCHVDEVGDHHLAFVTPAWSQWFLAMFIVQAVLFVMCLVQFIVKMMAESPKLLSMLSGAGACLASIGAIVMYIIAMTLRWGQYGRICAGETVKSSYDGTWWKAGLLMQIMIWAFIVEIVLIIVFMIVMSIMVMRKVAHAKATAEAAGNILTKASELTNLVK